jgi:crossover junction endodeoxyribonuclease RuvC
VRVLGIDPGLSRCGVGVVDGPVGKPVAVHAGVIRTRADAPMAQRLLAIYQGFVALLDEHRPDAVAVERVFFDRNVSTGIGVAQAAGLALVLAEQRGIPSVEYTPSEIKSLIAGDGAADKGQVGYMVTAQLRLKAMPKPADAADALAVALCHLTQGRTPNAGGMSPRLAAAYAQAGAGAQVVKSVDSAKPAERSGAAASASASASAPTPTPATARPPATGRRR